MREALLVGIFSLLGALIGAAGPIGGDMIKAHLDKAEKKHVTQAILTEVSHLNDVIVRHRGWWTDPKKVNPDNKLPSLISLDTEIFDRFSG